VLPRLAVVVILAFGGLPVGGANAQSAGQDPTQQAAPPPNNTPQNPPAPTPSWLSRQVGDIRALDKVSAGVTALTLRVGQSVQFGALTITLRSCLVRPPNQPADASAFLDITDRRDPSVGFHGWMFSDEPEVSMLEHPVYDIRLSGCHD
jgi:hypothetical protein